MISKNDALRTVSDNVRSLMDERGWSVRELARQSENDPMTISRLCRATNMPTADAIFRIAEAFNVTMDHLFGKN